MGVGSTPWTKRGTEYEKKGGGSITTHTSYTTGTSIGTTSRSSRPLRSNNNQSPIISHQFLANSRERIVLLILNIDSIEELKQMKKVKKHTNSLLKGR